MSINAIGLDKIKASSSESLYYDDLGISMHILKNVFITNNDQGFIEFNDPVYLMPTFIPYGHALIDCYSQYQAIKSKFPDTKIIFYQLGSLGYLLENSPTEKVIKDLMVISDSKFIIDLTLDNFIFKEIRIFFDFTDTFLEEFYLDAGLKERPHYPPFCNHYKSGTEPCGVNKSWRYNMFAIDYLKNAFSDYRSKEVGRKIFISRKNVTQTWKKILEINPDDFYAKTRIYEYEDEIEDLFRQEGFDIIVPDGMRLIDQVHVFSQASHLAGLSGTGFANVYWANNPKVYELCVYPGHDYHWKEFGIRSGVKEYFKIDCKNLEINEAINKIKSYL